MSIGRKIAVALLISGTVASTSYAQDASAPHPAADFSLTLDIPETTVKVGSDIQAQVAITNISGHDIYYGARFGGEPPFGFVIRDSQGTEVSQIVKGTGPTPGGGGGGLRMPLHPRETIRRNVILNQKYSMSKPDLYKVQAVRTMFYQGNHALSVYSNTATIAVTP